MEVAADRFVAGAWAGPFAQMEFERSASLCGSGAVVEEASVLFATAFHPLEWLFVLRADSHLWVSNSLPFLLTATSEELDLRYPHYFFDLLADYRKGVASAGRSLRLQSGRAVQVFACCSFRVAADLSVSREEKAGSAPPRSYAEYAESLQSAVNAILDNAGSGDRSHRFGSVATVSRGYDSVAAAALAKAGGCTRAVTFLQSAKDTAGTPGNDCGAEAARDLAMTVVEYDRSEYQKCEALAEAEFFMTPLGRTNLSLLAFESELTGCMLVTGRHGENLWRRDSLPVFDNFAEPGAVKMSGSESIEYCLRIGAIHLPTPYLEGIHGSALRRITHSDEMRPWSIGGDYDRPIARRIAEEAGVRREHFGQVKMGGGERGDPLAEESQRDFEAFYARRVRPNDGSPQAGRKSSQHSKTPFVRFRSRLMAQSGLVRRLAGRYPVDRLHPIWNSRHCYRFHWGVWRVSERYRAGAAAFK